ncbi:Ferric/cupric reductase transmembrane component 1 [Wickerhamiella sorbophila]|uniref:Ferric/cupric reductase transmembrane component 1 n=1 Tax=Wickerhamiella sorbophila TaxID=45607 RepID=A0A2T0FIH8_9ASCO|nr:Ferric/cupric reductase transmembrane component 1 [Wickerhamiella sorbophila]PRT54798.1 Ferric/cupric reductase transmembrane component 1 [Wickerhamiella sorbophila]
MRSLFLLSLLNLIIRVLAAGSKGTDDIIVKGCASYMTLGFSWNFCKKINKKQRVACFCPQSEWLDSVVACIDGLDDDPTNLNFHLKALKAYCKKGNVTTDQISSAQNHVGNLAMLNTSINSYKPRKVTTAFKLPVSQYRWGLNAYSVTQNTTDKATTYGIGMMCFWYGIVLIRSVFHWTRNFFPTLPHKLDNKATRLIRKSICCPPLLTFHHSTPATLGKSSVGTFFTFNLPTRQSAFIVLCYVAINLALLFAGLDIVEYNYNYDSWSAQYSKFLSVRSGWLVVYTLPVMFLFAGRNNFMIHMTGWPLDEFNVFHKWLGRCCFLNLVVHAGTYSYVRIHGGRYNSMWSTPYWQWGIAAIFFAGPMVFLATHWFRKLSYEIFLVIHILCAIGFVVAGYYHLDVLKEDIRVYYAVWAIWAFDRAARLGRVLVASPFSRATVTYHSNGNTLELTINYSKLWKVPPGSYVFVHIVQPTFFWESHPFSMMQGVEEDHKGSIKLFCRGLDGMTKRMIKKCLQNNGSFETYVWLDGPYHQYINTSAFSEAFFIAGGIGITAPFSYVQGHISKGFKDITVHWGIRDTAPLEWFADEISYMLDHGVQLYVHVGDETPIPSSNASFVSQGKEKATMSVLGRVELKQGRMDIMNIVTAAANNASGPLAILTCGPGPVNDLSRQAVVSNLTTSPHYIEYFEESFSW